MYDNGNVDGDDGDGDDVEDDNVEKDEGEDDSAEKEVEDDDAEKDDDNFDDGGDSGDDDILNAGWCDYCGMRVAWSLRWRESRCTKPCVFLCKLAAAGDKRYLVCAAGAVWIVSGTISSSS